MSAATKYKYGSNSVSKFVSLKFLLELRNQRYLSTTGVEYCPFEVEALINEKSNRLAASEVARFIKYEKALAYQLENDLATDSPPDFAEQPVFELKPKPAIKFNIIH